MTVIDLSSRRPRSSPKGGGGAKRRRGLPPRPRHRRRHTPAARQLALAATLLIAIAAAQLLPDAPPKPATESEVPLPFRAGGPYWSTPRLTDPPPQGEGDREAVEGASASSRIQVIAAGGRRTPATGQALAGRPTRIADGDTFTLAGARIRLAGIDAPEMSTPAGEPARRHLAALIAAGGGEVACEDTGERSYDRIVARCVTADGQDLAALMVEAGWARDWARFSGGRYAAAERSARADRRGMYGG